MRRAAGQSSVEFGVGLAALSLLAVSTLVICSWQEAERRVLLSARHSAFELSWAGGNADERQRDRLYRQFLGDAGLAAPLTGSPVATEQDVTAESVSTALQGATGAAEALLVQLLDSAPVAAAGAFNPGGRGWKGARVVLHVRPMSALSPPRDAFDLRLQGRMLLLDDGWAASGPAQVTQRAGTLVPTRFLSPLSEVIRPALLPLSLIEPSLSRFCPGLIDPDGVPEDRLSAAVARQPGWNSCR